MDYICIHDSMKHGILNQSKQLYLSSGKWILKSITFKSPDILAPAVIPVAAGKKTANTEKKSSPPVKCGPKFSTNSVAKWNEKHKI